MIEQTKYCAGAACRVVIDNSKCPGLFEFRQSMIQDADGNNLGIEAYWLQCSGCKSKIWFSEA